MAFIVTQEFFGEAVFVLSHSEKGDFWYFLFCLNSENQISAGSISGVVKMRRKQLFLNLVTHSQMDEMKSET